MQIENYLEDKAFFERNAKVSAEAKERKAKLEEALKWLMADKKGRLLMHELLAKSGLYRTTFIESAQRAPYMGEAIAFEEGRKQIGYMVLASLTHTCPNEYVRMLQENMTNE